MVMPEFDIMYFSSLSRDFINAVERKQKLPADIRLVFISIPIDRRTYKRGETTPEELSEAMAEFDLKTKMVGYNVILRGRAPRWVFETLRDAAEQSPWIAIWDRENGIATVIRSRAPEKKVGETFNFRLPGESYS